MQMPSDFKGDEYRPKSPRPVIRPERGDYEDTVDIDPPYPGEGGSIIYVVLSLVFLVGMLAGALVYSWML